MSEREVTLYRRGPVVRTKLTPPRLHQRTLRRPRVTKKLLEALDYRLTIVQAGPGYGKSTALATLGEGEYPLAWYHLGADDADPFVFLLHLFHSLRTALPDMSELSLAVLEGWEGSGDPPWTTVVDLLVNSLVERLDRPLFLILDDAHLLNETVEPVRILDRLIGRAPPDLHVILSTRYPPKLPTLVAWRVKGEVLEIGQQALAFTPGEVSSLFLDQHDLSLTPEEAENLAAETEGWAIALQLVLQRVRTKGVASPSQALEQLPGSSEDLFAYLAQEVLEQQPPDVQSFLRVTAVLREMSGPICDCLRSARDSDQILQYLLESGLFIVDLGDGYARYHHLFHDFLRHRLSPPAAREAHLQAAACFRQREEAGKEVYHLLAADAFEEAADILDWLGRRMVRAGRLDTLFSWINAMPPEVLEEHPPLLVYLGDIARLHSRFDEALGWYQQAEEQSRARGRVREISQALRGQARVYLDTVNPSQAEHLLQEALRLSDGLEDRESRARILEMMAENRLNRGEPEEAERFRAQARALREEGPAEAELPVRILLRTGRLDQARHLLEQRAEAEQRQPVLRPRAHRETLLLLSLILAFQGERDEAYRFAVEGTERGQNLDSPFITAVGYMRQGHAHLLRGDIHSYEEACRCYRQTIAMSNRLAVPRLKVEAFWGLCRAHGFRGAIEAAEQASEQGIQIAQQAGDEWVASLIRVSMGAGYAINQRYEQALDWLTQGGTTYRECGDTFGETVARLWQCWIWWQLDDRARLEHGLRELLQLVREHGYGYLFHRKTLLGPPDPRALVPLLLFARDAEIEQVYAETLLAQLGLEKVKIHPGYQLRVQTLGSFRVWRGPTEILPQEWRREKARQLFQLFLTYRQTMMDRDRIVEMLWPGLDPETAYRDFKVALSTLYRVLEPDRRRGAPSAYVLRDRSLYGLRPAADLWLDADRFEQLVAEGDRLFEQDPEQGIRRYREGIALYQGEYLEDCLYEEWASEERERLLTLYLRTADRLARTLVEQEAWEEAIQVCCSILARDDCWEQAYRLMMVAYARLGNRAQALRAYQRCVERLREELDVEPSSITLRLYQSLLDSPSESDL